MMRAHQMSDYTPLVDTKDMTYHSNQFKRRKAAGIDGIKWAYFVWWFSPSRLSRLVR